MYLSIYPSSFHPIQALTKAEYHDCTSTSGRTLATGEKTRLLGPYKGQKQKLQDWFFVGQFLPNGSFCQTLKFTPQQKRTNNMGVEDDILSRYLADQKAGPVLES